MKYVIYIILAYYVNVPCGHNNEDVCRDIQYDTLSRQVDPIVYKGFKKDPFNMSKDYVRAKYKKPHNWFIKQIMIDSTVCK